MGRQTNDFHNTEISDGLEANLRLFEDIFKKDCILRIRRMSIRTGPLTESSCAILYFDGMAGGEIVNESIVKPIVTAAWEGGTAADARSSYRTADAADAADYDLAAFAEEKILFSSEVSRTRSVGDMLRAMLYGDTVLLIDGCNRALTINTKGWKTRGVEEPADERVLQGPREGFGEASLMNLALLRRKLLTPDLCIEMQRIGRRTDTIVYICYLGSLTDSDTIELLKKRLGKLDLDGILDTNYINEQIRDHPHSFFKTTGTTERPDIVAARLLEGRIALMVDGTPVVLTIPYLFSENFQSDEDYYLNYHIASFGRLLRYICFFLAISVPAVYLALIAYHGELLPTMFALSIAQARGGIPLPSILECIILIFVFEILKETGARMPQSLGHALGIVGGLVIGQAAVEAKIISAPMLIAVALSGIAGLMIPRLKGIILYGKLFLLGLSYAAGIYGYLLGMAVLVIRIFSLSSFGVDYTISLLNPTSQGLKDVLWRSPWQSMRTRPHFNHNKIRSKEQKKE